MQNHIDEALKEFESVFSRHSSWLLFCAIVIGFIGTTEMIGITSLCRFWMVNDAGYHRLLHFFRAKAYCYEALLSTWQKWVIRQGNAFEVSGRKVLLGDHTAAVKDGRRMPGVVSMHESSETQS